MTKIIVHGGRVLTGDKMLEHRNFLPETISFMGATAIPKDDSATVHGLTGTEMWSLMDNHIKELKGIGAINTTYNLWDKFIALYPFIGGTADTHKWNMKNPVDSDAAHRMTWIGTLTHGANGVLPDGITGIGNGHVNQRDHCLLNDASMFCYDHSFGGTGFSMGCVNAATTRSMVRRNSTSAILGNWCCSAESTVSTGGHVPFVCISRTNSTQFTIYTNSTPNLFNVSSTSLLNAEMAIVGGLWNATAYNNESAIRTTYRGVGLGLNDAEAAMLCDLVTDLQENLGRAA